MGASETDCHDMSPDQLRAALRAALRSDLPSFVHKAFLTLAPGQRYMGNWHIEAICHQLERLRSGEITRLIINMPPRSLKSLICSVAWPAFLFGQNPGQRVICVSYSGDLARKFSNDFRALIEQGWYRETFPGTRIGPYKDTEAEIEFTGRGYRLATSTGGVLTGRGGDVLIVDDPLKPQDALSDAKRNAVNDWFLNTLLSRLDDKRTGKILIVMQRVHIDDLTGFVQRISDEWTILNLPAIATVDETIALGDNRFYRRQPGGLLFPDREPQRILDNLKMQLGSATFEAQYQQSPAPPGGAMIKRNWIARYDELPLVDSRFIVQSWDTAARGGPENDWSVCTTWLQVDARWYLLDIWRGRVSYPELKAKVVELAERWNADNVLIEEAGTALALIDELRYHVVGLNGVKPDRDKISRMAVASAVFEAGQVFFPQRASWLPDLEAELFAFPGSVHDDQVDSISQAINYGKSNAWIWERLAG